jgi:hypothetical protein
MNLISGLIRGMAFSLSGLIKGEYCTDLLFVSLTHAVILKCELYINSIIYVCLFVDGCL